MPEPTVELLLITGRAVFLVFSFGVAAVAFTSWRRAAHAETERVVAQTSALLERLVTIETRITVMGTQVTGLAERMDRPAEAPAPPIKSSPSYQLAIRLARSGASREELIESCGLSRQEAELVQRLHGPGQSRPHLQVIAQ